MRNSSWIATRKTDALASHVGGKAGGLFDLQTWGLEVPRFIVLTSLAYDAVCPQGEVPSQSPPDLNEALDSIWEIMGRGTTPLAVRSSAIEEDGQRSSYAGQLHTSLVVKDRSSLTEAVLACWRSLHNNRVTVYRRARKREESSGVSMAVVFQEMIDPEASGVLFTINPVNGRADELMISSLWGLGEGLVSGVLDADVFVMGRDGTILSRRLAKKGEKIGPAPSGGTSRLPVPEPNMVRPSLEESVLQKLREDGLRAAERAGHPLDIEFSVIGEKIHYLQARPVTAVGAPTVEKEKDRQVWDNSNIIESYPGITLPLTFSFIRRAYHAVYTQFCQVLGLSEKEIRSNDPMLANMLGLVRGRVYYNLLNWYRLVGLLPGFQFNKGFMEAMMGVRQSESVAPSAMGFARRFFHEFPLFLRSGLRAIFLQWRLPLLIRNFHKEFDTVYSEYAKRDLDRLSPHDAMGLYRDLEARVLWRWKAPIINDFSAMIYYGLLKKLTQRWGLDSEGGIQNALLSGQGTIESTEVTEHLLAVAHLIERDTDLRTAFLSASSDKALELLLSKEAIRRAFGDYLEKYGDRCVAELKLETVSPKQNPSVCMAILQSYVRQGLSTFQKKSASLSAESAFKQVQERLAGKFVLGVIPRGPIYYWVLWRTRQAVRNRENQRLARTRAYGLVRRLFLSVGRSFHQLGVLDRVDDIFFLEVEEIFAFIEGRATTVNLMELVDLRQREYEGYRSQPPPPDHFTTYGPVYTGLAFEDHAPVRGPLTGLGACPGVVEGKAVVLLEPDLSVSLEGCILIAKQTDPGWVILFPSIKGLAVERGSMLSHSAIVAREMGIPAVVGVPGLMSQLRTGDTVRLNGTTGALEILSRAALSV